MRADALFQGFNPVPTLCTIFQYPVLVMDPKHLQKAPTVQKFSPKKVF